MKKLRNALCTFTPFNPQEERDKALLLSLIDSGMELRFRENLLCHLTASAWIVNPARNRVLMAYHNLYKSWSWLGGHADGSTDLLTVAMREAREESGLAEVKAADERIFSVESLSVEGHEKRGVYVPSHLHLNVTYLLEADDSLTLHICEGENSGVNWFGLQEAVDASREEWFRERIYTKLNQKLKLWTEGRL